MSEPTADNSNFNPAAASSRVISQAEKAAIVVSAMLRSGLEIPLDDLSVDAQAQLAKELANLQFVERNLLTEVIEEFSSEVTSIGLNLRGGATQTLDLLEGKISTETAERLRKEAGVRKFSDPWDRLNISDIDELIAIIEAESIEVSAIIISKLDVSKAAALLGKLPGKHARQISHVISMTHHVTPQAISRIGQSLLAQLDNLPDRAFALSPEERVGSILTATTQALRDDVLDGLDESDPAFAHRVRQVMFAFKDIHKRLHPSDISQITRSINTIELATALAYAQKAGPNATATFILENLPRRMAENLSNDIAHMKAIQYEQGEAALNAVVQAIQDLVTSGVIAFRREDESAISSAQTR